VLYLAVRGLLDDAMAEYMRGVNSGRAQALSDLDSSANKTNLCLQNGTFSASNHCTQPFDAVFSDFSLQLIFVVPAVILLAILASCTKKKPASSKLVIFPATFSLRCPVFCFLPFNLIVIIAIAVASAHNMGIIANTDSSDGWEGGYQDGAFMRCNQTSFPADLCIWNNTRIVPADLSALKSGLAFGFSVGWRVSLIFALLLLNVISGLAMRFFLQGKPDASFVDFLYFLSLRGLNPVRDEGSSQGSESLLDETGSWVSGVGAVDEILGASGSVGSSRPSAYVPPEPPSLPWHKGDVLAVRDSVVGSPGVAGLAVARQEAVAARLSRTIGAGAGAGARVSVAVMPGQGGGGRLFSGSSKGVVSVRAATC
jgi:hypothetical protein